MKIFRSILLNEDEQIDTENIGCSWTLDETFAENHAKDINNALCKDGFVIISADVEMDRVDIDNTLFAMEERSYEFEVVLLSGKIEFEIYRSEIEGIEELTDHVGEIGSNDFEDYCEEYEGDLTIEDFEALAEKF